ncbi:MAG: hypothetical protein H0V01_01550 [Bacteroidetes bacterium]|nr:hypothetical protein [Bacteroidota bacterium]HET6243226.1 hypothetical protein [Bacteroidia bacterium]
MFELCKVILQKVSFDKLLFKKELVKATRWLKKEELLLLKVWCLATFSQYQDLTSEVFDSLQ